MNKFKKHIRSKHKQSKRDKQKNIDLLSDINISCSDEIRGLGIVLQTLNNEEITAEVLRNIAQISQTYVGLDVSLFLHHYGATDIPVLGSILHISDLTNWQSPVLATDFVTCFDLIGYDFKNLYYYVFTLDGIVDYDENIFNSDNVKLIFNTQKDMELIKEKFNIKKRLNVIPNFNLQSMCKIILEKKNEKK